MKTFIKIAIFLGLILLVFFFYYKYFHKNLSDKKLSTTSIDIQKNIDTPKNNIIRNLEYEIVLSDKSKYLINSRLSQIEYDDENYEKVNMQKVKATITDENEKVLIISSNFAKYFSQNHNTNFYENVKINYLDEIIECEKIFLNFIDKFITIEGNIKFTNNKSLLTADLMKINLLTKKIEIMMVNDQDKIKIYTN